MLRRWTFGLSLLCAHVHVLSEILLPRCCKAEGKAQVNHYGGKTILPACHGAVWKTFTLQNEFQIYELVFWTSSY